jgi:hypothetical protein
MTKTKPNTATTLFAKTLFASWYAVARADAQRRPL